MKALNYGYDFKVLSPTIITVNKESTLPIQDQLTLPCGAILPNRIAKAAMTEGLADPYDGASKKHLQLYRTWSKGGAGLLITGNVMVDKRYLERGGNVVVEDESSMGKLRAWAEAGTAEGNHLWMQINHPGRQCARIVNRQPVSPSEVQLELLANFAKPRALEESEILDIIQRFANTARIAKAAGFTGVQIHCAHGYLGSQFLSPVTNQRTDQWGGSLENRARFLLEVVRKVRRVVGERYPVAVKLNSSDFQKGGFELNDCIRVAQWLGEERIDLLEISGGTYEQLAFMNFEQGEVRDSTQQREAYFLQYAKAIQQALRAGGRDVKLMVTGGFRSSAGMNQALAEQECDVIGIARPLCTDPDLPNKLFSGASNQAIDYHQKLVLGKGFLGNNSSSSSIRAINNQGQAGWYYHQIECLAAGQKPNLKLGVLGAFLRHIVADFRRVMKRKKR